ncbi:MAG: hypothetical protein JEY71_10400 [Sphaerochaeta sp.]|nr:hypothetical protein [Sphaerochaeta sp.]
MKIIDALDLLKRLNAARKRTRDLARHSVPREQVGEFIDAFQRIEDKILDEVEGLLLDAWLEAEAELSSVNRELERHSVQGTEQPHTRCP